MSAEQQQPQGLEYQLKLLRLEAIHYRDTGRGAQHLLNAVFRVLDQQQSIGRLAEAVESLLDIGKRDMSNQKYDGYFWNLRESLAQIKGEDCQALDAMKGRHQP